MSELEQILGLFVAAVILAAAARRAGAPYPVFLALGGALLAFLPGAPLFSVPPQLALALFVGSSPRGSPTKQRAPSLVTSRTPHTAKSIVEHSKRPEKPFLPCVPMTKSATMPFTGWKRN